MGIQVLYLWFVAISFVFLTIIDVRGYASKPEEEKPIQHTAKVLVIVPCKGIDLTLYENLKSIKKQQYALYDVVAVTDSNDDPSVKIIKEAGIRHIVSASKCTRCSGKVRAISTAFERFNNYDVYTIADSDVMVSESWLRNLVAPLSDTKIGISTMFPYFNPIGGFWARVKAVWGFAGESLMSSSLTKFGWGGSLAFRKSLLDAKSLKFFKDSAYSISDDISLTKIATAKGLKVAYVRKPQPYVNSDDNFGRFLEWSNRQTKFSIFGNKKILYYGMAFSAAEIIVFLSGVTLSVAVSPIFLILLLHFAQTLTKNYFKAKEKGLRIGISLAAITAMMPFIYFLNFIEARRMNSVMWRGTRYSF
jgi:cellulose synthase/poly-beta-1,6-N-acetylglucosamine synthase-like glycosyltransferase